MKTFLTVILTICLFIPQVKASSLEDLLKNIDEFCSDQFTHTENQILCKQVQFKSAKIYFSKYFGPYVVDKYSIENEKSIDKKAYKDPVVKIIVGCSMKNKDLKGRTNWEATLMCVEIMIENYKNSLY